MLAPAGAVLGLIAWHPSAAHDDGALHFARAQVCIVRTKALEPWTLDVELADTPAQRVRGLMERVSLPADTGMLFRYPEPQPPSAGFWMPRVAFSLDIAFLDAAGVILAIQTMPPCADPERTPCPTYPARVPFHAALEVNGGAMAAHGIRPGHARVVACPTDRRSD